MKKKYITADSKVINVKVEDSFMSVGGEIGDSGEEGGDFDGNNTSANISPFSFDGTGF